MFWGCISKNKLGPLIEVDTRLNSSNYINNILVPLLQTFWTSFKMKKKIQSLCKTTPLVTKRKRLFPGLGGREYQFWDGHPSPRTSTP